MYLLIVTVLHYSDLVLQFNDPSLGEHLMCGSAFLLKGFSPVRKWTFGAGYNHLAVVPKPLF